MGGQIILNAYHTNALTTYLHAKKYYEPRWGLFLSKSRFIKDIQKFTAPKDDIVFDTM